MAEGGAAAAARESGDPFDDTWESHDIVPMEMLSKRHGSDSDTSSGEEDSLDSAPEEEEDGALDLPLPHSYLRLTNVAAPVRYTLPMESTKPSMFVTAAVVADGVLVGVRWHRL